MQNAEAAEKDGARRITEAKLEPEKCAASAKNL
jgi:hypothetical protein